MFYTIINCLDRLNIIFGYPKIIFICCLSNSPKNLVINQRKNDVENIIA